MKGQRSEIRIYTEQAFEYESLQGYKYTFKNKIDTGTGYRKRNNNDTSTEKIQRNKKQEYIYK